MIRFKFIMLSLFFHSGLYTQSQIIFSRSAGGLNTGETPDLMVYDTQTNSATLLFKGSVRKRGEYGAAVSPDGSKLIVNTYKFGGWKLGIADFKNGEISNLEKFTKRRNYEYNPSWSHDGEKVAYEEYNRIENDTDIFIADKSGNSISRLTQSDGVDRSPAWTRNNKEIVFTSGRADNYEIYIQSSSGRESKNLTNHKSNDFAPSTSSENEKIAFLSDRGGLINLYTMNYDGSSMHCLTENLTSDRVIYNGYETTGYWAYKTTWSPDGKQIAFNVMFGNNLEIFLIDSDGSNLKQLTNNQDSDFCPFWKNEH
ncbi:MAG: DPP IV N-terminal domain-containing protein [Cyclobacteriaceae bacterium]